MTTTVFLVRHASHDRLGKVLCGRMDGVGLSEQGRREAQAVGARLAQEAPALIYASPLQRTLETAGAIAAATGVEVRVDEDLLEIDFGSWTGKSFDALEDDPAWQGWNRARALSRPPGGESMTEVQTRLRRWLERTCAEWPDGRVAAVTHSDVIKCLAALVLGFSLDQHDRLEVSPGSVTTLVAGDWGMKLLSLSEGAR